MEIVDVTREVDESTEEGPGATGVGGDSGRFVGSEGFGEGELGAGDCVWGRVDVVGVEVDEEIEVEGVEIDDDGLAGEGCGGTELTTGSGAAGDCEVAAGAGVWGEFVDENVEGDMGFGVVELAVMEVEDEGRLAGG